MTVHSCPFAVRDEVVTTEHKCIDGEVFSQRLKGWISWTAVRLFAEEMEWAGVGGECVVFLQMDACSRDGIVPNGVVDNGFDLTAFGIKSGEDEDAYDGRKMGTFQCHQLCHVGNESILATKVRLNSDINSF